MEIKETILVVEDDNSIAKLLANSLISEYKVIFASNLEDANRKIASYNIFLILLDLGLPDGDGKNLIKKVRLKSQVPIIVVSARSDDKEIIHCLDLGADDYVTKPFSITQLHARIRSASRRYDLSKPIENRLKCNELCLDVLARSVSKEGVALKLTPTEYNLLKFFMSHPNQVLTHQTLLKEVWGVGYQNQTQYLRTYINSLRKKIENDTTRPEYILTESSIGYRFMGMS